MGDHFFLTYSPHLSVPLFDLKTLSHDLNVAKNYEEDSKNHLALHSKLLIELVKCSRETYSKPLNIKCPAYVVVGTGDEIVCAKALEDYFTNIEKSFTLKKVEDGYHELHNEIDKYREPYLEFLKDSLIS